MPILIFTIEEIQTVQIQLKFLTTVYFTFLVGYLKVG